MGADRDRIEPLHQTELAQLFDRMRQRAGMQHQCEREPADPTANDNHLHGL
jgi:hypothetical protein